MSRSAITRKGELVVMASLGFTALARSAVESWLRTEVVASIKAVEDDSSSVVSSQEMRAILLGLKSKYEAEETA